MHVAADLNWFLQFIVLTFAGAFGLLYLVRNTASRYFVVDSSFDSSAADYSSLDSRKRENMGEVGGGAAGGLDSCAVCGLLTKKQCARCKMVKYCSEACQKSHWSSGHKTKCKDLQSFYKSLHTPKSALRERKALGIAVGGSSKIIKQSNKILFPYEEFLEFFSWDKPGYPPCGLLNCGNSCFANVVLQCLAYTRPLVAYVLEKGHRRECQRDDWCFMCEFQTHVERASRSLHPFSPMNILSRLPNIGGNLGYGKQEDAHEFMRFAIDMMQSVCLDEFGGEKAVHPSYQETTLIQHIFGGRLRSQVICAECNNVSNQFENLMDLTVEIHGDAGSLEECLDQFTAKEWLHGDNMYKCDGCNAYVMAWKRLTVQRAPNILTIALKRFQSGRFGKLNKRVTFPETLDLNPYMSELEDGNDIYKLYAVIVHVDMLNASFFGHYICYVKDFGGKWHKIDDCKVASVGLDEVLSQGAYMLLYNRICARPSCLIPTELLEKEKSENVKINEVDPLLKEPDADVTCTHPLDYGLSLSANCPEDARGDAKMVSSDLPIIEDVELHNSEGLPVAAKEVASPVKHDTQPKATNTSSIDTNSTEADAPSSQSPSTSDVENACHESKTDINLGLLRSLCEESADTKNCRFKESSITCDVSAMDITTDEVKDTSMPENVGCGNALPFSDDNQNAAKKLNGESSVNFANSTSMPENVGCGNAVPLSDDIQNAARKLNGECSANSANSTSMSEKVGNGNAGPSSNGVQNAAAKRSNGESSANSANSTSMPENVGHGNAGPSSDDIENSAKRTNGESSPNSANSTSMPENVGYAAGPPSDDIQSAVKKSNGESSAAKFKPIFAPGFLGKHPRKSSIKPEDKASTKVIQLTPESHPNNHTREAEKSSPSSENGGGLIKQKRLHIVHENRKADISKVHANGNSVV